MLLGSALDSMVVEELKKRKLGEWKCPLLLGGIIPQDDIERLRIRSIKDFDPDFA